MSRQIDVYELRGTPWEAQDAKHQPHTGGTNRTFTLTAEQVRAMKDAGMWDNPEKRAKMIKRYAEQARNTSRSN